MKQVIDCAQCGCAVLAANRNQRFCRACAAERNRKNARESKARYEEKMKQLREAGLVPPRPPRKRRTKSARHYGVGEWQPDWRERDKQRACRIACGLETPEAPPVRPMAGTLAEAEAME